MQKDKISAEKKLGRAMTTFNLLAEGMEIKSIVKITGLSEEEIRKL